MYNLLDIFFTNTSIGFLWEIFHDHKNCFNGMAHYSWTEENDCLMHGKIWSNTWSSVKQLCNTWELELYYNIHQCKLDLTVNKYAKVFECMRDTKFRPLYTLKSIDLVSIKLHIKFLPAVLYIHLYYYDVLQHLRELKLM